MSEGPIRYISKIVEAMIQARTAWPVILETINWLRQMLSKASEPVPTTQQLADMIDEIAACNVDFNRSEIDRLQAKLAE